MKKIFLYMLFCFLILSMLHTQNFSNTGEIITLEGLSYDVDITSDVKFENGYFIFRDYDIGEKKNNYIISSKKMKLIINSRLTYLVFDANEKLLVLANDEILVAYDMNSKKPKIFGTSLGNASEFIDFPNSQLIQSSSEFSENGHVYRASNISNLNLKSPWVEGVSGNGIGETISFKGNCSYLYLFNGFVSFEKPSLYEENARIKKIKISFPEEKDKQDLIVDLNDTPNPQKIKLGFRCNSKIKIEILDVYEGSKYQDACLNCIMFRVY